MANYNGYHSTWVISGGTIQLKSTGLPYHSYGNPDSTVKPSKQSYNVTLGYKAGTNARGRGRSKGEGVIGYWMNGVAIYGPSAGNVGPKIIKDAFPVPPNISSPPKFFNFNTSYFNWNSMGYTFGGDLANGCTTAGPNGIGGVYHYQDSRFMSVWQTGAGATNQLVGESELSIIPYYNTTLTHPDGHSKILGWSLDGFPIYGPFGYNSPRNPTNGVRRMTSGYTLKDSSYRTGVVSDLVTYPMGVFVQDYYFAGGEDLDTHNGRFCVTPDFPKGTYAYFLTIDENSIPAYPYVIGETFYGDVTILLPNTSAKTSQQPQWQTPAGNIGAYSAGSEISIVVTALSVEPASTVTYKLQSGSLPSGLSLTPDGVILGVPDRLQTATSYNFTIRATDNLGNVRDRSFSIEMLGEEYPKFTTPAGLLFSTQDSIWTSFQVQYTNTVPNNVVKVEVLQGRLPPGLEVNDEGLIRGYPQPPKTQSGVPTTTTYTFSLILLSTIGTNDIKEYSITVANQQLKNPPNTRVPAILNNQPLTYNLDNDIYRAYYTNSENNFIGEFNSGDEFYFKVIGHDFDYGTVGYEFSNLPLGLVGDPVTGWISGVPVLPRKGINQYSFYARVAKINNPTYVSQFVTFTMSVNNEVDTDIIWVSPSNLGTIASGSTSNLSVKATCNESILYRVVAGTLPTNLIMLDSGDLVGKIPFQPEESLVPLNGSSSFTFTVEAYSPIYPLVKSFKEFTVTVVQDLPNPVETLYFKATPSIQDRIKINSLLTDTEIIPTDYLYRPNDPNYGKASSIVFPFAYGIEASSINQYLAVVGRNFYNRNITLGELKKAHAHDENNEVIYEVIYSQIIDNLENPEGTSISKSVMWPTRISLQKGPWLTSNTEIFANYAFDVDGEPTYYASMTPGYTSRLYPNSIQNMTQQILTERTQNTNRDRILPLWMTSQQVNGDTLGFTKAWVICYTKPGFAQKILDNINNNWPYKLNQINFQIDRYSVDKSTTYNWNSELAIPNWMSLPSAIPEPDPIDSKDFYVLFPRQTILPKDEEQ